MNNNTIPIIISSDDNYIKYLAVTLYSILYNGKNSFYDFYLLLAPDVKERNKNLILKIAKRFNNNNINFINMGNAFTTQKKMISHISNPTYYRLKAAEILPSKYKKCLYFDTDVIINIDLEEYFNINIDNYYIAGVLAAYQLLNKENNHHILLEIPNLKQYINAGVVILNLYKIRKNNLTKTFLLNCKNNYPTQDQDVLNKCCYGHIKILPLEYNIMTKYNLLHPSSNLLEIYSSYEIKNVLQTKKIIHYADKIKPWQKTNIMFSCIWWRYAIKTPFITQIIIKYFLYQLNPIRNFYKNVKLILLIHC